MYGLKAYFFYEMDFTDQVTDRHLIDFCCIKIQCCSVRCFSFKQWYILIVEEPNVLAERGCDIFSYIAKGKLVVPCNLLNMTKYCICMSHLEMPNPSSNV